jgi:hypothetical protein
MIAHQPVLVVPESAEIAAEVTATGARSAQA